MEYPRSRDPGGEDGSQKINCILSLDDALLSKYYMENLPTLTVPQANQLMLVQARIFELRAQKVTTPTSVKELSALEQEFETTVLAHSGELLGAFMLVKNEYEPLMRAEAIKQRRAAEINIQVAQMRAAQAAQAGNIVDLKQ